MHIYPRLILTKVREAPMADINIKSIVDKAILKSRSSNTFRPEESHRRAKSAFWAHYFSSGELPPGTIEPAAAARISGFNEVLDWWTSVEGFSEWFQNGEEFRQRVEYISHLGLGIIENILLDSGSNNKDKLTAARMALEIAAKFPKQSGERQFADERINDMDKKQLEEFIASKLKQI